MKTKNPQFGIWYDVDDYDPPYGDLKHPFNYKKMEEEREKEVNAQYDITSYKGNEVCKLYNHDCGKCGFFDDVGCVNPEVRAGREKGRNHA